MNQKGVAVLLLIVILDIGTILVMGLGNYGIPAFDNQTIVIPPAPTPPPAGFCNLGFQNYTQFNLNAFQANESIQLNLSKYGLTLASNSSNVMVVNSQTNNSLVFEVVTAGNFRNGQLSKNNVGDVWLYIDTMDNKHPQNLTGLNFTVLWAGNSTAKDNSTTLLNWADDFESYSVATGCAGITRETFNDGGNCQVLASNGQKVLSLDGAGNTVSWLLNAYSNVSIFWELNSSASAANDQQFFYAEDTHGKGFRAPYIGVNNVWSLQWLGSNQGDTISFTGAVNTPINLTAQNTGNTHNIWINAIKGGNYTVAANPLNTTISWINGVTRKGLMSLTVYNTTIYPYTSASYATNVSSGKCY